MSPTFSDREYDQRLRQTRKAMDQGGIDWLFVTDPSNMAWLTGYDGWSFYVHQGVLLGPEGPPIWWGRQMDGAGAQRTVWMARDCIRPYAESYVQSTERHPMQDLAKLLAELGAERARVGIELENYYYSAKAHQVLTRALPFVQWVDATALVNWQRLIKSPAEIALMRAAAAISDKLVQGVLDRIAPGLPKNEMVAEILRDAMRGTDGVWGDYPAIMPMLPSGADASAPHLTWDGRPFKSGEATFFELAGCHKRYHAPLCRTVFLGAPPDRMLRATDALVAGLEAGLEAARAGNRACDIANALARKLESAGISRSARCGYPVGLSYPPDWGERTVSLRAEDTTELRPGMTFHFMPGLWMQDWGLEITETILIKENGAARPLCTQPRRLFVKP